MGPDRTLYDEAIVERARQGYQQSMILTGGAVSRACTFEKF